MTLPLQTRCTDSLHISRFPLTEYASVYNQSLRLEPNLNANNSPYVPPTPNTVTADQNTTYVRGERLNGLWVPLRVCAASPGDGWVAWVC